MNNDSYNLLDVSSFKNEWIEFFEIPLFGSALPEIKEFEIADGRVITVVKEGINEETIFLGNGNGDGVANPGESVVILIKDAGRLWRTSLTCHNQFVNPYGINTRISDNWGKLTVNQDGCLVSSNFKYARITAKGFTAEKNKYTGDGWQLLLNSNWEVIKVGQNYFVRRLMP